MATHTRFFDEGDGVTIKLVKRKMKGEEIEKTLNMLEWETGSYVLWEEIEGEEK